MNPTGKNRSGNRSTQTTALTTQEKEYVKAHEDEYRRIRIL